MEIGNIVIVAYDQYLHLEGSLNQTRVNQGAVGIVVSIAGPSIVKTAIIELEDGRRVDSRTDAVGVNGQPFQPA